MKYSDPTKLRAYFFGNMYLSPIQQGIQAAHVVTKLFVKYGIPCENSAAMDMLYQWGNHGVTKILLNGGYQSNLDVIHNALGLLAPELGIPYAKFHEETDALNGALTCVGVIVPEEIYAWGTSDANKYDSLFGADAEAVLASLRDHLAEYGHTGAARHLHFLLKSCRLA